jgi:pimeloyl-ACP methyl ester carboxylesterase/membrane protein DedA with SNARE-associated domain
VGGRADLAPVRLAYHEWASALGQDAPVLVLIHGSPGDGRVFHGLAPLLTGTARVIAPDLPGFGSSSHRVPDYSIRAHATYVRELLDSLHVSRAHIVGFSMGGGVALELERQAPDRVRSLTLLSAIGVQELELLGDYHLNHAIHGLQLAGLWLLREGVPHFGWLDDAMLGVEYARNFFDSDQRPLRGILERYPGPMLILHGEDDILVPVEAAREHARLVPQSDLILLHGDHFMTFMAPERLAAPLRQFVTQVETGHAVTRADADAARLARATQPWSAAGAPHPSGFAVMIVMLLIAAATLVSEDLTCIGTGLLVADGRLGFLPGVLACLLGIFAGDLLLFFAGKWLGRRALTAAPLRWVVRKEDVERSVAWFEKRGMSLVIASRFVPGTRLPTYLAAGILHTRALAFIVWFLAAALVWTPLLVGASSLFGHGAVDLLRRYEVAIWPGLLATGGLVLLLLKVVIPLCTYRGRRLLLSRWRRLTRWEFWPMWAFYPPVVLYILYLGFKHRSLSLFTAVNPAIPGGGFVGESKAQILRDLGAPADQLARFELLPAALAPAERIVLADEFMARNGVHYPVVLKPDAGERGSGVVVVHSEAQLVAYLGQSRWDTMIQEFVHGHEFGVFYYRKPGEHRGRIFSITEKRIPVVTGDGVSTLEQLILGDDRAVCLAPLFLRRHADRLPEVPPAGRQIVLGTLGNHCRGAVFLNGWQVWTPELEAAIDRLSRRYRGFFFGRYDVCTPSLPDFRAGTNFKVIELNGATSEATHIYDPTNSLRSAYRTLFEQWRILFAIAAHNRREGVRPLGVGELFRSLSSHRERIALHPET